MGFNKKNCFGEIRLALAMIVMLSHAYIISGMDELYYFSLFFDANFAVKSFFAISGYLVTTSYLNSESIQQYVGKRIRRVYPAYIFVIVYCFVIGMLTTSVSLSTFFQSFTTYKYLFGNLLLMNFIQHDLPGVFANHNLSTLNGSLWTIKVEVLLYAIVPFILFGFRQLGQSLGVFTIFLCGVIWFAFFTYYFDHPLATVLARQFPGQLPYFVVGSFLAISHFSNRFWNVSLFISVIYLVLQIPPSIAQYANMIIYPIFIISLSRISKLSIGIGRIGDLSYGLYLFHFPTLQFVVYSGLFILNPWLALLVSVLVTLLMAYVSWHFVESRFLNRYTYYVTTTVR